MEPSCVCGHGMSKHEPSCQQGLCGCCRFTDRCAITKADLKASEQRIIERVAEALRAGGPTHTVVGACFNAAADRLSSPAPKVELPTSKNVETAINRYVVWLKDPYTVIGQERAIYETCLYALKQLRASTVLP